MPEYKKKNNKQMKKKQNNIKFIQFHPSMQITVKIKVELNRNIG